MIISNNEELEALAQRLFPKFNEFLMRNSKNIFSCELATSLDGILTMPALYDKDGVQKQVIAPLKLLTKDVDAQIEACKKATAACIEATTSANTAAKAANDATADLDTKKKEVDAAVKACKSATDAAKTATSDTLASKKAIEANEDARKTAEQGRVDAEKLRVSAETKREADFKASKTAADDATSKALSTYSHPPYVDADGYYYKWNVTTQAYNKTDVNLTGKAFQIKKVFASVAAMNATSADTFAENDFILINTANVEDEDNAKLYVVALNGSGKKFYSYLVDMSGFRGFTGKTPQLTIGTVTTLAESAAATATISANGTDADGNPRYKLNFGIPRGVHLSFADLTDENKAELMKPATDAASRSDAQTKLCKEATSDSKTQTAACKAQTDITEDINAHPLTMGDNGNWFRWNTSKQLYEDTGIIARGGVMFPSFRHKRNKLLMLDYGSNIINRVARKRNKLLVQL